MTCPPFVLKGKTKMPPLNRPASQVNNPNASNTLRIKSNPIPRAPGTDGLQNRTGSIATRNPSRFPSPGIGTQGGNSVLSRNLVGRSTVGVGGTIATGPGAIAVGGTILGTGIISGTLGALPFVAPNTVPRPNGAAGSSARLGRTGDTRILERDRIGGVSPEMQERFKAWDGPSGTAETQPTESELREKTENKSRRRKKRRKCNCPGTKDKAGDSCGGRAAFWRPKGKQPTCSGIPSPSALIQPKTEKQKKVYKLPL